MVNLSSAAPCGDRVSPAVRDGNDRRILKTITSQIVTAAIWRRRLPEELEAWLEAQKPVRMLQLGLIARPKVLFDELNQAADAAGIADGHARQLFLTDVCELARDFARIVKAVSVEARLSVVREKVLQTAEGTAGCGTRLLSIYRVARVRHLGQPRNRSAGDWRLSCGGTLLRLGPASVVAVKDRPANAGANGDAPRRAARAIDRRPSGLYYMLELRP